MTERERLLKMLAQYGQRHPEETAAVQDFTAFVSTDENYLSRTNHRGHVTGSVWVLDTQGTHALMTFHRKLGRWLQLGGHCEQETRVVDVARRELQEESGLTHFALRSEAIFDIDKHLIPEHKGEPAHYHYDVRFLFSAERESSLQISEESTDLRWIPLNDLAAFAPEESVARMVRKSLFA